MAQEGVGAAILQRPVGDQFVARHAAASSVLVIAPMPEPERDRVGATLEATALRYASVGLAIRL